MSVRSLFVLIERQMSDETRLRRAVAIFQRQLGDVFGNASARRRNGRYELDIAVYEKPVPGGRSYRMPDRQIRAWVKLSADRAHPRLHKRLRVEVQPWRMGHASNKLFAPVRVTVIADGGAESTAR